MTAPKVSIGLPVYNGSRYVAEAIESVLAQTYCDFELTISDNASTDDTPDICRALAERDPRVRYFRAEKNGGAPWNFNRAFELSRGEYFKWLAHDDVVGPRFLERTVAELDRDPSIVLCHAQTAIINGAGQLLTDQGAKAFESWHLQGITEAMEQRRLSLSCSARPHQRYLGILLYSIRNHEVFGLIRRQAMLKTGLHHAYCGGEKVFLSELSLVGRFKEIDEVLAFSRWHPERFSSNASARAQHLHMNPNAKSRLVLPRQARATWGYWQAIRNSDLGWLPRARCGLALGRFMLQIKKWKKVIADYTGGIGQLAKVPDSAADGPGSHLASRHWSSIGGDCRPAPAPCREYEQLPSGPCSTERGPLT